EFSEDLKRAFASESPLAFPEFKARATTQQYNTIPLPQVKPDVTPKRLLNSPLGILAFGMTVIAVLLLIGILSSDENSPSDESLYFFTNFAPSNIYTSG